MYKEPKEGSTCSRDYRGTRAKEDVKGSFPRREFRLGSEGKAIVQQKKGLGVSPEDAGEQCTGKVASTREEVSTNVQIGKDNVQKSRNACFPSWDVKFKMMWKDMKSRGNKNPLPSGEGRTFPVVKEHTGDG